MQLSRKMTWMDRLLGELDHALRTLSPARQIVKRYPDGIDALPDELTLTDSQQSARLMRVNHAGEVSAQALYRGQAFWARKPDKRAHLLEAAAEEEQHLHWCEQRLQTLNGHPSILAPVWYAGSLALGSLAGLAGDRWSLGFVEETEIQVGQHLDDHLQRLPAKDQVSRAILQRMREDELTHADNARSAGAQTLPGPIKSGMKYVAKVMTTTSYYL